MSREGEHPIVGDADTLTQLRALFDDPRLGTREITRRAREMGLRPPADGPDWIVTIEFAPDGSERGLFWDGPDDE